MNQYEVLEMSFCGEKDLEETLNSYAKNGWKVVSIIPSKINKFAKDVSEIEELVIVFEK